MEREEAINLIKQVLPCLNIDEKIREGFVTLIPELKESEDEKIRKELLEEIEFIIPHDDETDSEGLILPSYHARIDRYKSYLEKQKEQKPIFKKGDKVIWDDEEFNILDVNETEYNVGGYRVPFSRQNELHPIWQKSAEWSEEDERTLESFLGWLQGSMGEKTYSSWLKSLPERFSLKPKQEWSEEFLRLMGITISQDGNQVCVLLGENLAEGIAGFGDTLADAVEEFKKEWRQFDRFRKATWKPSEEQIRTLDIVISDYRHACTKDSDKKAETLKPLLEQLEKL